MFNEVMLMIILYHLVLFSRFNLNDDLKFFMGYVYAFAIIFMVFVNISLMIRKMVLKFMSNRRKKANYKAWLKKIEMEEQEKQKEEEEEKEGEEKQQLGLKLRPVNS